MIYNKNQIGMKKESLTQFKGTDREILDFFLILILN